MNVLYTNTCKFRLAGLIQVPEQEALAYYHEQTLGLRHHKTEVLGEIEVSTGTLLRYEPNSALNSSVPQYWTIDSPRWRKLCDLKHYLDERAPHEHWWLTNPVQKKYDHIWNKQSRKNWGRL